MDPDTVRMLYEFLKSQPIHTYTWQSTVVVYLSGPVNIIIILWCDRLRLSHTRCAPRVRSKIILDVKI